jgi:hypothetical protein
MPELPDITVQAEVYKDDYFAPATLFFNYARTDIEGISCGVLFHNSSDIKHVYENSSPSIPILRIRAVHQQTNLWIPRMRVDRLYREHWDETFRGTAELLVEGRLDDFQSSRGKLQCYVLLQDNPLLGFYDEQQLIQWTTPFGPAKLIHDFRYGGYVRDMKERKPQKKDMIFIELNPTHHESLYDLISAMSDYLDDLMWLISFLCKKYVHWYKLEMLYEPEDKNSDGFRTITAYRDASIVQRNPLKINPPGYENHPAELLIQLETMRSEVADRVFRQYFDSNQKDAIKHIIITLMVTFTDSIFEQDLGIVYTALEALIDSHTEPYILGNNRFKNLKTALEGFLKTQDSVELTAQQLDEIQKKLPELRRFSFITRTDSLFEDRLQAVRERLPKKTTPEMFRESLAQAIKRRNFYIHKGQIQDYSEVSKDLALMRFLVSLWILDFLGYPLSQINQHDPDLMWADPARRATGKENDSMDA